MVRVLHTIALLLIVALALALEDPEKLVRFRTFVNSPAPDPSLLRISERGQPRPAHPHEKRELLDGLVALEKTKSAA